MSREPEPVPGPEPLTYVAEPMEAPGLWQVRREDGIVYAGATEDDARRWADGLNAAAARPSPDEPRSEPCGGCVGHVGRLHNQGDCVRCTCNWQMGVNVADEPPVADLYPVFKDLWKRGLLNTDGRTADLVALAEKYERHPVALRDPASLAVEDREGPDPTLTVDVAKFVRWSASVRDDTAEAIAVARALNDRISERLANDWWDSSAALKAETPEPPR